MTFLLLLYLAQQLPTVSAVTLDNQKVQFPRQGSNKPLLVSVGFSHKSASDLEKWNKQCASKYWTDSKVEYYEVVDLQGMPGLVKGMALHGMRKSVSAAEASHFTPIYSGEAEWKKVAGFQDADVVYFLVADAQGKVLWQEKGPSTPAKCSALDAAVAKALVR